MSTTELAHQLALAAIDGMLATAEAERNRSEQQWARMKAGTKREQHALATLHELDRYIERLGASRHRLVCGMRGERHLKAVPGNGVKETRHG